MKVPPGLGTKNNRGNPPYEEVRHYFFDMGNDSVIAFFEIPKGAEPPANRNAIGSMQHCAFVVTQERFREVEERLRRHNVRILVPFRRCRAWMGFIFSIPMEFAWSSRASPPTESIPTFSAAACRPKKKLSGTSYPGWS